MKNINVCIHDNKGNIRFDKNIEGENVNEVLKMAGNMVEFKIGDIIRIEEEDEEQ